MLAYHFANPLRVPNWDGSVLGSRENRIRGATKRTNDKWLIDAYRFQIALAKCKDEADRYELMDKYPDIYGAYLIYNRGDAEERHPARFAIEARILASQSDYDIARRMGIRPEVIAIYENVFFNVRDKLSNKDYISTVVMGPSIYAGLTDRDYDLLWKLYGYMYGPVALDAFINSTSRTFRPEKIEEVDAALAEDIKSTLVKKVAVTMRTFTINQFSPA